jgi:hypothetical protein
MLDCLVILKVLIDLKQIKEFGAKNQAFSDVLRAAADPSSKPMYRQKSGQQNPVTNSSSSSSDPSK